MKPPRVSIGALMLCVLVVAIGTAALRYASETWAGVMLLLVLGLLAMSVLGVVYRRGAARAGWLGFLLFGGGYLFLAFAPGFDANDKPELPAIPLLGYLHKKMNARDTLSEVVLNGNVVIKGPGTLKTDRATLFFAAPTQATQKFTGTSLVAFISGADLKSFERVGQCLFALVAGLCGAALARRFERKSARDRLQAENAASRALSDSPLPS